MMGEKAAKPETTVQDRPTFVSVKPLDVWPDELQMCLSITT